MFSRSASDQFRALVEANLGSPPPALQRKSAEPAQWLRPGIVGRVRHLRGEATLRHATLVGATVDYKT